MASPPLQWVAVTSRQAPLFAPNAPPITIFSSIFGPWVRKQGAIFQLSKENRSDFDNPPEPKGTAPPASALCEKFRATASDDEKSIRTTQRDGFHQILSRHSAIIAPLISAVHPFLTKTDVAVTDDMTEVGPADRSRLLQLKRAECR